MSGLGIQRWRSRKPSTRGQNLTHSLKDSQSFEGRDGNRWVFERKKGHVHAHGRRGGSQLYLVEGCFYT